MTTWTTWPSVVSTLDDGPGFSAKESAAPDIIVSRCQHDKTMLIGADPSHVDDRKNCLVINLNFFSNLDWIFFQF
ncbi:hypothetical protein Bca101_049828 [Brassica carinata]